MRNLTLTIFTLLIPIIAASQDEEFFRINPQYTYQELLQKAQSSSPPKSSEMQRDPMLMDLEKHVPNLRLEIRYATNDNFMGMKFYETPKAYLQKPAVKALVKVARSLKKHGLGIVVYDAYRPWYVTKMFWDATPDSLKKYVADPQYGSKHNRGCAVDLGLYYLESGQKVPMPTDYDDFTEKAHVSFGDTTEVILLNRQFLQKEMNQRGFKVYQYEWWHFDYKAWRKFPVMNSTFAELSK